MTHYEISYANLTPQEKYSQAYSDILDYMGGKKLDQIINDFKQYPSMSVEALAMYMSIAGISGYPVSVLHDMIWPYG